MRGSHEERKEYTESLGSEHGADFEEPRKECKHIRKAEANIHWHFAPAESELSCRASIVSNGDTNVWNLHDRIEVVHIHTQTKYVG